MIKVLIFSDSHGKIKNIERAIELEKGADIILHAGDYVSDIRKADTKNITYYYVGGNCDYSFDPSPDNELINIGNVKILLTHGHTYYAKQGLSSLHRAAVLDEAQAVVFGHTHIPIIERMGGVLMVNPGTIGAAYRGETKATYARMFIDEALGIDKAQIVELE